LEGVYHDFGDNCVDIAQERLGNTVVDSFYE